MLSNFVLMIFDNNSQGVRLNILSKRCDLLSNFVLMIFDNNGCKLTHYCLIVVICFQTLFLWSLITTSLGTITMPSVLWFAFKLCSYDLWQQLGSCRYINSFHSCDLLSNFVLMIFDNNTIRSTNRCKHRVVICFQTLFLWSLTTTHQVNKLLFEDIVVICFQTLFLWSLTTTTPSLTGHSTQSLWFAFKLCSYDLW